MILPIVKQLLSQRLGHPILYPSDCEVLREDIEQSTNQRISTNTLKRLLGFLRTDSVPRAYTFDILAHYLGFVGYDALVRSLNPDKDTTEAITVIFSDDLHPGDVVRAVWTGGYAVFEAAESGGFLLKEMEPSDACRPAGKIRIRSFRVGLPLYMSVSDPVSSTRQIILASVSGIESLELLTLSELCRAEVSA